MSTLDFVRMIQASIAEAKAALAPEVPEAKIQTCSDDAWLDVENIAKIKIPVVNPDGSYIPSSIGVALQRCPSGEFSYSNEREVNHLCRLVVYDAISSLGLVGKVKTRLETSLYSSVGEMIILEVNGRVVFVIVVKAPELKDGQVFTSRYVGGQVWLNLMSMKQHGCERPIGAIMTFNKICLVSLEDLGKDNQHLTYLQEVKSLDHRVKPITEYNRQLGKGEKLAPGTAADDKDIVHDPEIYCSRVYGGNTIYPALIQGMLVAYRHATSQDMLRTLPTVKHGDNLGGRLFARMGTPNIMSKRGCLEFVTAQVKLQADEEHFPARQTRYFYMLRKLGTNQNSCYAACDSSGRMCCVKLYVPAHPQADWKNCWNRQIEALSRKASKDAQRWHDIYGATHVYPTMLGGVPALILPYGHQIEINERQSALKEVERILRDFVGKGYFYAYNYLRWHDVLKDHEGNIFLASLGSLRQAKVEAKPAIEKQVEALREFMDMDLIGQEGASDPERPRKQRKT